MAYDKVETSNKIMHSIIATILFATSSELNLLISMQVMLYLQELTI